MTENKSISIKSLEKMLESAHDKDELARAASFLLIHAKTLNQEEGEALLKLCLKKGGNAKRMVDFSYAPGWWAQTYFEGQLEKSWDDVSWTVSGLDEHAVILEMFDKWCHSKWGQSELEKHSDKIKSALFSREKYARILLKIEIEKPKPFIWLNSWCAEDVHVVFLESMRSGSSEVVIKALEHMNEMKKKSIVDFQQALKISEAPLTVEAQSCISMVENSFLKGTSYINKKPVRAL